jgi:hypothetical protein
LMAKLRSEEAEAPAVISRPGSLLPPSATRDGDLPPPAPAVLERKTEHSAAGDASAISTLQGRSTPVSKSAPGAPSAPGTAPGLLLGKKDRGR